MVDIKRGISTTYVQTVTDSDIVQFAQSTGDNNPVHLDADYAKTTPFGKRIAHGMLSAGFISTALGTKLPGPGTIYLRQTLEFRRPAGSHRHRRILEGQASPPRATGLVTERQEIRAD